MFKLPRASYEVIMGGCKFLVFSVCYTSEIPVWFRVVSGDTKKTPKMLFWWIDCRLQENSPAGFIPLGVSSGGGGGYQWCWMCVFLCCTNCRNYSPNTRKQTHTFLSELFCLSLLSLTSHVANSQVSVSPGFYRSCFMILHHLIWLKEKFVLLSLL